jgi:hypothetical protein
MLSGRPEGRPCMIISTVTELVLHHVRLLKVQWRELMQPWQGCGDKWWK